MNVMGIILFLIYLAVIVLMIVGIWKTFQKAGKPGWAAIIPLYNIFVMIEVARMSVLWFILLFIPIANIVAVIMISIKIAVNFGKSEGFGIGLWLLPFVFYPILGLGDAKYQGQAGLA